MDCGIEGSAMTEHSEGEDCQGLEIKVLGPGRVRCDRLEQELMAVMAETGVAVNVEHVGNPKEIAK
jgi:hypothetical protein